MSQQRTHGATTNDGVTIRGAVHGQGPPLVFSPGGIGDSELDWSAVLPHMTGRFTCHLPSFRGRGRSDDHPDMRSDRLVEDLVVYVDSLGEATGLVGWSAGGIVLVVAARSDAVDAVAAVEPTMIRLLAEHERASLGEAVVRMKELAAVGELPGAARAFLGFPFNGEELAIADEAGYFRATGRYVPTLLAQLGQTMGSDGSDPGDPDVLGAISAPVLVVYGSDTRPFLAVSARYVADHVADARLHEIPGAGHATPLTHPKALAEALVGFFRSSWTAIR